jgi:N-acetylneuraminic acid mutarotase
MLAVGLRWILPATLPALALPAAPAAAAPATWTNVTWSTTYSQPYRNSEAQGFAIGGKLYSFSGFDALKRCANSQPGGGCAPTSRAYRLNPAKGWTALAAMPSENATKHGGVTHSGFATDGTYAYWAGGNTADAAGINQIFGTREAWRYDPAANAYRRMPDLPQIRGGGELEYLDGKLHYFGGYPIAHNSEVGDHWALDLSNQAAGWVALAPVPNPRSHMGSAVLGGRIYAIGGQHGHDAALITQPDVDAYDPATNTWTRLANLPKPLGHISGATFAMDGRIVVMGGETANNAVVADVYAYTPDTNHWTALAPLPSPRRSGVADVVGGVLYYTTGRSATTFKGVPDTATSRPWPKRFNFQPAGSPVPAGYTLEAGLGYDAGRGFGWVREDSLGSATHTSLSVAPNARDRGLLGDQRQDTFIHMQFPATASSSTAVRTPAAWELAVPDGSYDVTVSVGDAAANYDSKHVIDVEGTPALGPFVPTSGKRFASVTTRATVGDGRLTLDARGGANTKIDYVEIDPVVAAPTTRTTSRASFASWPPASAPFECELSPRRARLSAATLSARASAPSPRARRSSPAAR